MTQCVICTRPVADQAYACQADADRTARHLDEIAGLAGPARAVVHGQTRRGPAVHAAGGPGRIPLSLAAGARLDAVQAVVTSWARHVIGERGSAVASAVADVPPAQCAIGAAVAVLATSVEWMRHRREVDEFARDVAAAVRVLRGVVDGPGSRRWLGQCEAPTDDGPCRLDINARPGAATARCRCGASVDVAARLAKLAKLVRGYSYTAKEINEAYPEIPASTIRVWAHRGRILPTGEIDGRPVYDLGEVLDRARDELVRRGERQARRGVVDQPGAQGVTCESRTTSVSAAGSAA